MAYFTNWLQDYPKFEKPNFPDFAPDLVILLTVDQPFQEYVIPLYDFIFGWSCIVRIWQAVYETWIICFLSIWNQILYNTPMYELFLVLYRFRCGNTILLLAMALYCHRVLFTINNEEMWQKYRYFYFCQFLVCDLNRTPIVTAKHGGPCVHFSGISTCRRTSRETVSHPQHAPLPTLCKIYSPVYVIMTNERLQPVTTTWYSSLVLSFSLLKI